MKLQKIPKLYWLVLKAFLNNKKLHCIWPPFQNDQFIMNFKKNEKKKTSLLSSVLLLVTTLSFSWFLLKTEVSHFEQLSF